MGADRYIEPHLRHSSLKKRLCEMVKKIKKWGLVFDGVAFSGSSGLLLGPPVAMRLRKNMILVRKQLQQDYYQRLHDGSHSSRTVESPEEVARYIIVDDLICTGKTVRYIIERIRETAPDAVCVGIFLTDRGPKDIEVRVGEKVSVF